MGFVFVLYGLCFVVLAIVVTLQVNCEAGPLSFKAGQFLAFFGFSHGVFEWSRAAEQFGLGMLVRRPFPAYWQIGSALLLVLSFIFLLAFSVEVMISMGAWKRQARWLAPSLVSGVAFFLALYWSAHRPTLELACHGAEALARYSLAFPGCLIAAYGLHRWAVRYDRSYGSFLGPFLDAAAGVFLIYGVAAGLLQPGHPTAHDPIRPMHFPELWVYGIRSLCGLGLSVILMQVFVVEIQKLQRTVARLREEFIAFVSHDIRSAMSGAATGAELLHKMIEGKSEPQKLLKITEHMRSSLKRANAIIDDLHDASCLEAGQMEMKRGWFSLASVLQREVVATNELYPDRRIRLELPVGDTGVIADELRITQVIHNLLSNALKYSPPGADILARVEIRGKKVVLSIVNGGPGIPSHELSHVFERFYRTEMGRTRATGSGLGLFIVRELVEANGGTVTARSSLEGPTEFAVALPRAG